MTRPYRLSLDLRVLDHLGLKLYSNAAAVLSEAVANAWDADAQSVSIDIQRATIVIEDDGVGMDLGQINDRFLAVGYDKRQLEGEKSPRGRLFMGRKGIGKLALFSIAGVIEVHTRSKQETHAFKMVTADIKAAVKAGKDYFPTPIAYGGSSKGTRLVLRKLTKKRTSHSIPALRKRIARRFSIIGYESSAGDRFRVRINGTLVGPKDREDLRAVEFLWEFGSRRITESDLPSLAKRFTVPSGVSDKHPTWKVKGWLGAAAEVKKLRHDQAGSLNGLVVLARGRLIQENILDKLNFNRILGSYLTGQVEADFLDRGGEDDIATSDRQRLVEDDPRYQALTEFLRRTLVSIQDKWTDLRNTASGGRAVIERPILKEWVASLPESQRGNAQQLLGVIRGVELEDEGERTHLFRSGVVAFERLRLREAAHLLAESGALTAHKLLPLLADLATLEGSLYRDIVKGRIDVIKDFESLVDGREKEKVLQRHLFENLWLLDPGWERAAGSERIEQTLKKDYAEFAPRLTAAQSKGRVDIRYRTNADQHMIVELKRAGRRLSLPELVDQGNKYLTALTKCLESAGYQRPHISVVFVVGRPVIEAQESGGDERVSNTLSAINARVVHYEALIRNARQAYDEYLQKSAKVDQIERILKGLK